MTVCSKYIICSSHVATTSRRPVDPPAGGPWPAVKARNRALAPAPRGPRWVRIVPVSAKSNGDGPSEGERGQEGGTSGSGDSRDKDKPVAARPSGWLFRLDTKREGRKPRGWNRLYTFDPALRNVDRKRRPDEEAKTKIVSGDQMDVNEVEEFLDSWALDIADPISDWEDAKSSGRKDARKSWTISGEKLVDRVQRGRDQYLNPMLDVRAWVDKLNPDEEAVDADLRLEMRANEWESRQAVKFAGILFLIPFIFSSSVRWLFIDPGFEILQENNPTVFALSDKQKLEGAHKVKQHEARLRFYAGIGKAPPLTDAELQYDLRKEAIEIAEEFRRENRSKLENMVSDSVFGVVFMFVFFRDTVGRRVLFRTMSRFFGGLSDTGKAFIIISAADIVCGYHSEEGWGSAVNLICEHYGWDVGDVPKGLFVSFVPILLDTLFKLWLFTSLNKQSPSTVVTVREMDRH